MCLQANIGYPYPYMCLQTNRTSSLVEFHDRHYGELFTGHRVSNDTPRTSAYKEKKEKEREREGGGGGGGEKKQIGGE